MEIFPMVWIIDAVMLHVDGGFKSQRFWLQGPQKKTPTKVMKEQPTYSDHEGLVSLTVDLHEVGVSLPLQIS